MGKKQEGAGVGICVCEVMGMGLGDGVGVGVGEGRGVSNSMAHIDIVDLGRWAGSWHTWGRELALGIALHVRLACTAVVPYCGGSHPPLTTAPNPKPKTHGPSLSSPSPRATIFCSSQLLQPGQRAAGAAAGAQMGREWGA